jgi:beta-glucosidase
MQPTPPAIIEAAPTPPPTLAGPWIPAERPWSTEKWLERHDGFVARSAAGGVDVLYLGDSITDYFATRAPEVFAETNAGLGAVANYGIEGDRTQFVLWRIEHGELDHIAPRVVVLLIGTNNLASATPINVARGITAIVAEVRRRLPHTTIVLNAIFPRGVDDRDPLRIESTAVNSLIAPLADGTHVRWLDAGPLFLDGNGSLRRDLLPDALHPNAAGYKMWGEHLRPLLLEK